MIKMKDTKCYIDKYFQIIDLNFKSAENILEIIWDVGTKTINFLFWVMKKNFVNIKPH